MSIAVVSAKGGVGKSTFCVGVGKMLASHNKKTLLVDMDIGVRSLDMMLGVSQKTVYHWGDIILGNCDKRKAIIRVSEHLDLLPAPLSFDVSYTPEKVREMIADLEREYDFILSDAPAGLESGFQCAVASSRVCIVMATTDGVSIRAAGYAAENVRKLGCPNIRLVVNQFDKKSEKSFCADDVIDSVGAMLLGVVPKSNDIGKLTRNGEIGYNSKGNQAFLRIAKRLCGENVPISVKEL